MLIAIDFDGVCRHPGGFYDPTHEDIPGAARTIKQLLAKGHDVKILTARHEDDHDECHHFLNTNHLMGVPVEGSPIPHNMLSKIDAEWDWLIDDANELREVTGVIYHVSWKSTREILEKLELL